jgi:hypothetical protein
MTIDEKQPATNFTSHPAPLVIEEALPSTSVAPPLDSTYIVGCSAIRKAGRRQQGKQGLNSKHVKTGRCVDWKLADSVLTLLHENNSFHLGGVCRWRGAECARGRTLLFSIRLNLGERFGTIESYFH